MSAIRFAPGETVRTAYRQIGSGPLLLLIHGAEADHTMFLDLMAALAADFSVVAYDQRDSGATENSGEPYGLESLADDAAVLIEFLLQSSVESSLHVYGTSFGGQIAQILAARHPCLVNRLVLGSTWSVGRKLGDINPAALERLASLRGQLPESAAQIAGFFFSETFLETHPETVKMFRGSQRTSDQARLRALLMRSAPPALNFSDITAPTLLLAGSADRLIPATETFALSRCIADTHQQELSGLPHVGAIEDPKRVAHTIRNFLLTA